MRARTQYRKQTTNFLHGDQTRIEDNLPGSPSPLPWSKLLETQILTRDQFAVLTFLQHSPRIICPFAAIRREPVIFHKLLHFFGVEMLGSVVTKNCRPRHRPRVYSEQLLLMGMCNYSSEI